MSAREKTIRPLRTQPLYFKTTPAVAALLTKIAGHYGTSRTDIIERLIYAEYNTKVRPYGS